MLNPPFSDELVIHLEWNTGDQKGSNKINIKSQPIWNQYLQDYPEQTQHFIKQLHKLTHAKQKTARIIIWRFEQGQRLRYLKEIHHLVREWVTEAGLPENIPFYSTRKITNTIYKTFEEFTASLDATADIYEVWLIDQGIWNLDILRKITQNESTLLIIPDLVVRNRQPLDPPLRSLLDEILSPKDHHHFAPLQWTLKSVVHGILWLDKDKLKNTPPLLLARDVKHSDKRIVPKFTYLDSNTWKTPRYSGWPVVGISAIDDTEPLPNDPVKPLQVLASSDTLQMLKKLGLINYATGCYTPASALVTSYISEIYPGFSEGIAPEGSADVPKNEYWQWNYSDWNDGTIERAISMLFSRRGQPPAFKPIYGLGFDDWEALSKSTQRNKPHDAFFSMMGLNNNIDFRDIQASLKRWQSIFDGKTEVFEYLINHLSQHNVEIKKRTDISHAGGNIHISQLGLIGAGGLFNKLYLLAPDIKWLDSLSSYTTEGQLLVHLRDAIDTVHEHIRDITPTKPGNEKNNAIDSICMLILNNSWPQRLGLAKSHKLVHIGPRYLIRLATDIPTETIQFIARSQIRLEDISQGLFKTRGPVEPDRFYGRTTDLVTLCGGLNAASSYVVTGPRSIGKSSLLKYLPYSASWKTHGLDEKFVPIFIDVQKQRSGKDIAFLLDQFKNSISSTDINYTRDELNLIDNEIQSIIAEEDETAWRRAAKTFEHFLRDIKKKGNGRIPLLIMDEADGLYNWDAEYKEPLFTTFRALNNSGDARFVFASYPPRARKMAGKEIKAHNALAGEIENPRRQAYNFLEILTLGPMTHDEGVNLIESSLSTIGILISKRQADLIAEECYAIPRALQESCISLLRALDRQFESGGDHYINERLLEEVVSDIREKVYKLFSEQIKIDSADHRINTNTLKIAFGGLLLEGKYTFQVEDFTKSMSMHAGVKISDATAMDYLDDLLDSLLLERRGLLYSFSGLEAKPYWPDITLKHYGNMDKLENGLIHRLEREYEIKATEDTSMNKGS